MPVSNTPTMNLPYKWGFFVAPFVPPQNQLHLLPLEAGAQATYMAANAMGEAWERFLGASPGTLARVRDNAESGATRAHNLDFTYGMFPIPTPLRVALGYQYAAARGFADGVAADGGS